MLEALELSKADVGPPAPPNIFPAGHPFYDPTHPLYNHPMNPYNPLWVNPSTGERNINGFPGRSWRWLLLSREWWVVLRPKLWEHTILRGRQPYGGFLKLLESTDSQAVRRFVKVITLKEDWAELDRLWRVLSLLRNLDEVIYCPKPITRHYFQFGVRSLYACPSNITDLVR